MTTDKSPPYKPQFFSQESKDGIQSSVVQSHVATRQAASLAEKLPFVLVTVMMSRGYEVMPVSNFKGLRQTHQREKDREKTELLGCRKGDVVNSCLCQKDKLFTVAANELEL